MTRKTQLTPQQLFSLDLACQPIRQAFDAMPYLVGTVTERRGWRDVDVRLILDDKQYNRMSKALGAQAITFLGFAISTYLRDATGLPIDFQFQRMTEANASYDKPRNPLGCRTLRNWPGDARPEGEA
jgi:hypothetical protein